MSDKEEPSFGEPANLEHIMASELYPKKSMKTEDPSLLVPYPILPGESVEYLGKTADGVIALSDFRLLAKHGTVVMNIPLALVDTIECRDIFFLYVYCKDARSFRCAFSTNESCLEWYKRLSNSLNPPIKLQDVFAFSFHAWCVDECANSCSPELDPSYQLCQPAETTGYSFGTEVDRLGFDLKKAWRICYVNEGFKTTATYPELHIVPASISDDDIRSVAAFRSSRRFPSVVWRDQRTGATISRSSQPEVGWLGWRSVHDENLLQAISKACSINLPLKPAANGHIANGDVGNGAIVETTEDDAKKMLIIDARSYAAALGNRAKGGGCECPEYYQNCEIQFMSLANIHTIRKSFQALRALCAAQPDQTTWLSGLENTKWLHHVAGLMRSAMVVVNAVAKESRSVLVHCSDGWDRTPQIVALAELMLDPHYRTIEGFQVMVEREWLAFGHKFADRCALGMYAEDTNERCPIFLQFLDCVHQLVKQFPCAFQFNEAFLVKLVQHTYSCLFGNFLCNSVSDRQKEKVVQQTSSVWSLLRPSSAKFRNYLYTPNVHQVLRPSCHLRHLNFWNAVYLSEDNYTGLSCNLEENYESTSEGSQTPDQKVLPKTRSFDDIKAAVEGEDAPTVPRRLSDPNITVDTYLLGQEIAAEDKRLTMNQDVVSFKNIVSSDVLESDESDEAAAAASCVVENGEAAEISAEKSEESASSHTLCNNITVIEGSTETLTGELADTSAARTSDSRSITPVVPASASKDGSEPADEAEASDEVPVAEDAGLSLCKSASISTSTTEISNSHISLKLPQHLSTVPRCNGTSLSLFIPDVAMAASGVVPNKQLTDPIPSSRSSNDSTEAESPFTGNSRTPGSVSPPTPGIERSAWQFGWRQTGGFIQQFDCDGLTTWVEAGQARLAQIETEYQGRIETLQRQLHLAKLALQHFTMYNGTSPHIIDAKDENGSQAESQESGEHMSLGAASDISWEHVEEKDAKMTLWVPDHAVTHCAGCNQEFWIVRRKHHCRNCGQVYCGECTRFTSPVPQQQLNNPVRVCRQCYITIQGEDPLPITSCRHCGEELQFDEGLEILTSGRSTPDSDTDKTTTPTCS